MTARSRHPLIPPRDVDARQELPALEEAVLERWRERDVFGESLRLREGAEPWIFYEGPPTANGRPGSHHVLSRVFKDIYPRYKTMRGYRVERKGGWDCHGLPVEIGVERELGISSKAEIERYGIERFNAKCRESVFAYLEEWNRLTERIGFWVDLEDAYRTLDESYIESVWWALAEIDRKGLLYEGHKVVPYCPRCGTALSSHEVALGYEDVVDPSIFIKLPLSEGDEKLLVWTTTPWTLPGNVAVAVRGDTEYLRVRHGGETLILAAPLARRVLGEQIEVAGGYSGEELAQMRYEGPIFRQQDQAPQSYPVVAADFVTTDDGTGLVHIAPAFGEDDFNVARTMGLTMRNPVRPDGTYDERVTGYEGRFVKDPRLTEELIGDLQARGLLLKREAYEHSYPHCWRCGTPLIYYATPSWYIATSKLRERMLAANETVTWHPSHIKHGRFGDWLKNNVDWAISRERYWGTPLPVWRCDEGHKHTVGSFSELERLSGEKLPDHHRPFVDEVRFACVQRGCEQPMRRVPEVIDVWFDSGAMPFAQYHAPLEHSDRFKAHFPADFICEALDQTRGWFYSLLAVSTLLFDTAPYRNVVCLGLILDAEGQKMSKSKGNTVEPWLLVDAYGADAFRWYFFTSKQPWDGYRFSEQAIGEGVRLFLKQLWSTYFFYVLYAHANRQTLSQGAEDLEGAAQGGGPAGPRTSATGRTAEQPEYAHAPQGGSEDVEGARDLDRWALSRTAATAELVAERMDAYDATTAGRALAELVDSLSNWYVRRSRRRFWDGDPTAFATLRECLLTTCKLLAPFCPFIADEIYDNLDGTHASVHLCDFPAGDALPARDEELEEAMATARETVRLGLGARARAKIKVRQPLAEAVVVADGRERAAIERMAEIVREELNVRRVRFVQAADELGEYEVKANYRTLGPLFGKDMPLAARAIAALDPARVATAVLDRRSPAEAPGRRRDKDSSTEADDRGRDKDSSTEADDRGRDEDSSAKADDRGRDCGIGITVGGREHTLLAQDVILTMKAPEGYSVEREGAHAVALDLTIDEDLLREGRSREIVHAVQNARKTAGLEVEDRIELALAGDPALIEAARTHADYLGGETLAVTLALGDGDAVPTNHRERAGAPADYREQTEIEGLNLEIALRRVY